MIPKFTPGCRVDLTPEFKNCQTNRGYVKDRFAGHEVVVEDVVDSHPERALRTPDDFPAGSGKMARLKNDAGQVWYTHVGNLQLLAPTPLHFSVQEMLALSTVPKRNESARLNEVGQEVQYKRPDVAQFFESPVKVIAVAEHDPGAAYSTIATLQNEHGVLKEMPVDYLQRG